MQAWYVPPEQVPAMWERFRRQVERALSEGAGVHMDEAHYLTALASGQMQMIAVGDTEPQAIGVFSTLEYPKSRVLFVELLAGENLANWLPYMEPILRQWRDHIGATTIEASCRPGLAKRLTNWTRKAVLMELK